MPKDFLAGAQDRIRRGRHRQRPGRPDRGQHSGRAGRSVLLLEQHYKLGGMATWFKRPGGHIFDISLHGFPFGMIKSCRRYWTQRDRRLDRAAQAHPLRQPDVLADDDVQPRGFHAAADDAIRRCRPRRCTAFFDTARGMNFYDDQRLTTRELFEQFFPGREDVIRLLMEPITYANGSTLEDPAISYGIVFSNFMSQGRVHVRRRHRPADRADARRAASRAASMSASSATSSKIHVEHGRVAGVDGQRPHDQVPAPSCRTPI